MPRYPLPRTSRSTAAHRSSTTKQHHSSHLTPLNSLGLVLTRVIRYTDLYSSTCLPDCLIIVSPAPTNHPYSVSHPTSTRHTSQPCGRLRRLHPLVQSSSHHHITFPSSHPPTLPPDQPLSLHLSPRRPRAIPRQPPKYPPKNTKSAPRSSELVSSAINLYTATPSVSRIAKLSTTLEAITIAKASRLEMVARAAAGGA